MAGLCHVRRLNPVRAAILHPLPSQRPHSMLYVPRGSRKATEMNANQIINMVVRTVMRQVINRSVRAGMDAAGKGIGKGMAKRGDPQPAPRRVADHDPDEARRG